MFINMLGLFVWKGNLYGGSKPRINFTNHEDLAKGQETSLENTLLA